jgi:polyhydroxybutyrate depolymerase
MRKAVGALFAVTIVLSACSSNTPRIASTTSLKTKSSVVAEATVAVAQTQTEGTELGAAATNSDPLAARPFDVVVPKRYDVKNAAPLLLVLHGYTGSGKSIRDYFDLDKVAEERGLLTVYANGTKDSNGSQFWNATDACCNFGAAPVDDSAYLTAIIEQVEKTYNVDPKRIYLAGHSNGGFMSYRMACEHANKVAAIVSLAGAMFADTAVCKPSEPVSILQIHGSADEVISFGGGQIFGRAFPSAATTVASWSSLNDCTSTPAVTANSRAAERDLDAKLPGAETRVSVFANCRPGGATELWTIEGGAHSPALSSTFASDIVEFQTLKSRRSYRFVGKHASAALANLIASPGVVTIGIGGRVSPSRANADRYIVYCHRARISNEDAFIKSRSCHAEGIESTLPCTARSSPIAQSGSVNVSVCRVASHNSSSVSASSCAASSKRPAKVRPTDSTMAPRDFAISASGNTAQCADLRANAMPVSVSPAKM